MPEAYNRHFPDLGQKSNVAVGAAAAYSFRWVEGFSSWAIFTVNDATGEFSIQSDWGNWSYRWNVGALGGGKTLTQFLATCSGPDYITNKLGHGEPRAFTQEIDHDATINTWKAKILNARLLNSQSRNWLAKQFGIEIDRFASPLEWNGAAEAWYDLKRFDSSHDLGGSEAEAVTAIGDMFGFYDSLYGFLGGNEIDIWDSIETRTSWAYEFLCGHLLPFFFDYLRENVVNSDEAKEAAHGG